MLTVLQRLDGIAYRDRRLMCARAVVTIVTEAPSARHVRVRFVEGVDQQLRDDLQRLMARRGAFAAWLAERLDPIEIVGLDAHGNPAWRLVGRLERPAGHYWPLTDTEFWLRESTEPTTVPGSSQADEPTDGRLHPASPRHDRR